MIVRSAVPYNAEPRPDALIEQFLTPQRLFYIRSHGAVPDLPQDHRVAISGIGVEPRAYALADLRRDFAAHEVTAALQCAGNRRTDFQAVAQTKGDPWDIGAIGNARWTGVRLADLLDAVGASRDPALHLGFTAADTAEVEGETAAYGVSIGMAKARDPDVLLCWAMNGEALTPDHGAPLRLVVPGYAGVRSIKWLTAIEVRDAPSDAPIQAKDYKLFPAAVAAKDADWASGLTIEAMPLNAAICTPRSGATLDEGMQRITGYAIAYGRAIARVEVSLNGGREWRQVEFADDPGTRWGWVRWSLSAPLARGRHHLVVRAFDDAGQAQPERPDPMWNFAGYLCTAWHHVHILVD